MRNILATVVAVLFLSGAVLAQAKTETPKETKTATTEMKGAEKTAEAPAAPKARHHHMKSKASATNKMAKKSKTEKEKGAQETK